jgi:hypothetical protein
MGAVSATTVHGVEAQGGSGTFNFNSLACAYVSSPLEWVQPGLPTADLDAAESQGLCTVTLTGGQFVNVVCGTGTASATAVVAGEQTNDDRFFIDFVATVGIAWGNAGGDPFCGVVLLAASTFDTPGDPTANQCVNSFDVVASTLVLDLPGAA